MIEKMSHFRNLFDLDNKEWTNVEYIHQIYDQTLGSYPMINLGKFVIYGGALSICLATSQICGGIPYLVEAFAGGLACLSGLSLIMLSDTQFENYVKHLEAKSRLKKFGIKKNNYLETKKEKEL